MLIQTYCVMPPQISFESDKYSADRGGGITMQHDLAITCSIVAIKKLVCITLGLELNVLKTSCPIHHYIWPRETSFRLPVQRL